ncbi:MAG: Minf_1886 family protein [Candidatus Eisenbacteria bacterium]
MASEMAFWDVVNDIRETDDRFRPQAYVFLMVALQQTVQSLPEERLNDPAHRHLSGRELLDGMARLAREEFGRLAPLVFAEWGVTRSEDVGEMVFQLVENGQLSARPEDTLDDFRGFDLDRELVTDPGGS